MIHELKCWPPYFEDIFAGRKTFEIRRNDRDYQVGDVLWLREYLPVTGSRVAAGETTWGHDGDYTGREVRMRVTFLMPLDTGVHPGGPAIVTWGLEGYVAMSIKPEKPAEGGAPCSSS